MKNLRCICVLALMTACAPLAAFGATYLDLLLPGHRSHVVGRSGEREDDSAQSFPAGQGDYRRNAH